MLAWKSSLKTMKIKVFTLILLHLYFLLLRKEYVWSFFYCYATIIVQKSHITMITEEKCTVSNLQ